MLRTPVKSTPTTPAELESHVRGHVTLRATHLLFLSPHLYHIDRGTNFSPNSYSPSKTISLSKVAKVLSNFISAEIGGSQAVFSYLTRASASFNALVQFHKELKNSKFDHIESTNNEKPMKYEHKSEENKVGLIVKGSVRSHSARKRHKQSRKNNDNFVIEEVGEVVDSA
ncbi:hypothetical protein LOK49_LG05G01206 [Camellia lanceoleosa]|uniref:Uncharacterized protein n=1 Tax=Camellia lanceoleosa TaxID=1840588 RepID=A0ACC0HKV5_9ERIC|nr:hypothetical protein LOK49_LG05G01206 [Camellia lanceoleosa]